MDRELPEELLQEASEGKLRPSCNPFSGSGYGENILFGGMVGVGPEAAFEHLKSLDRLGRAVSLPRVVELREKRASEFVAMVEKFRQVLKVERPLGSKPHRIPDGYTAAGGYIANDDDAFIRLRFGFHEDFNLFRTDLRVTELLDFQDFILGGGTGYPLTILSAAIDHARNNGGGDGTLVESLDTLLADAGLLPSLRELIAKVPSCDVERFQLRDLLGAEWREPLATLSAVGVLVGLWELMDGPANIDNALIADRAESDDYRAALLGLDRHLVSAYTMSDCLPHLHVELEQMPTRVLELHEVIIPFRLRKDLVPAVRQAGRMYAKGEFPVVVILARAALEASIRRTMDGIGQPFGTTLGATLKFLAECGELSPAGFEEANMVRIRGNKALHTSMEQYDNRRTALATIRSLAAVLKELRPWVEADGH